MRGAVHRGEADKKWNGPLNRYYPYHVWTTYKYVTNALDSRHNQYNKNDTRFKVHWSTLFPKRKANPENMCFFFEKSFSKIIHNSFFCDIVKKSLTILLAWTFFSDDTQKDDVFTVWVEDCFFVFCKDTITITITKWKPLALRHLPMSCFPCQ